MHQLCTTFMNKDVVGRDISFFSSINTAATMMDMFQKVCSLWQLLCLLLQRKMQIYLDFLMKKMILKDFKLEMKATCILSNIPHKKIKAKLATRRKKVSGMKTFKTLISKHLILLIQELKYKSQMELKLYSFLL